MAKETQADLFYILKAIQGNCSGQPGLVQYEILGLGGFETPSKARDWLEQETGSRAGFIVKQLSEGDFQQDGTVILDFS